MDITTLPNRTVESFKYTDLTRLLAGQHLSSDTAVHQTFSPKLSKTGISIMPDGMSDFCLPTGVSTQMIDFDSALKDPQIRPLLTREINTKKHPLAHKIVQDKTPISIITIDAVLNAPLEIIFNARAENFCWNSFTIIHLKSRAKAEIEYMTDLHPSNLLNQLFFIQTDDNATLRLNLKRENQANSQTIHNCQIWQQRDSTVKCFYANEGEKIGRYDAHVYLCGTGAEFKAAGFYRLKNKEHVDHHITAEHLADYTNSTQFFKGILDDQSHGVFNGGAVVHQDVKNADAKQHNFNLLLSGRAAIDTKPELEIYTDVVTAAHGSAVGQLDEEALFYLQSRGIDELAAKKMLIDAFFADVEMQLK